MAMHAEGRAGVYVSHSISMKESIDHDPSEASISTHTPVHCAEEEIGFVRP
jgi:nucleoid DNA-binding protein